MSTRCKLRLRPLSLTESVRLSFTRPADLNADLDRHVALHAQAYRARRRSPGRKSVSQPITWVKAPSKLECDLAAQ